MHDTDPRARADSTIQEEWRHDACEGAGYSTPQRANIVRHNVMVQQWSNTCPTVVALLPELAALLCGDQEQLTYQH